MRRNPNAEKPRTPAGWSTTAAPLFMVQGPAVVALDLVRNLDVRQLPPPPLVEASWVSTASTSTLRRGCAGAAPDGCAAVPVCVCWAAVVPACAVGCAALAWVARDGLGDFAFPPADGQLLAALPDAPEFAGKSL